MSAWAKKPSACSHVRLEVLESETLGVLRRCLVCGSPVAVERRPVSGAARATYIATWGEPPPEEEDAMGRAVHALAAATGMEDSDLLAPLPPPAVSPAVVEQVRQEITDGLVDGGLPTWIDEAGEGGTVSFADLWRRCVEEVSTAAALLLYCEPGEVLKGALVEVGSALVAGVPVFVVGDPPGAWPNHPLVGRYASVDDALAQARAAGLLPTPAPAVDGEES